MTANEIVTFSEVKRLAQAEAPCVTIVVPIGDPLGLPTRMKNAVHAVEKSLDDRLMEPIRNLARAVETAGIWGNTLILFRSPDVFQSFLLHRKEPEMKTVEARFQVRPLLAALTREQEFFVLGLSRKHVRLLKCTQHGAEKVSLRAEVPQNFHAWLNTRKPDHDLDNHSTAGRGAGSMRGVVFGTSTDRERQDESLAHFFKAVDEGVHTVLRDNPARLLLCGVEEELAVYRRVTAYPRLFKNAVHGSPDAFSDAEMHQHAIRVAMQEPSEVLEKALAHFTEHRDDRRTISDVPEIVKAAWEGRVSDLFISEGAEFRGLWDPGTLEIKTGEPQEDLLNAAALQTVLHGGQAFRMEHEEMPLGTEVTAVLRF
jgi:hypothetical protein